MATDNKTTKNISDAGCVVSGLNEKEILQTIATGGTHIIETLREGFADLTRNNYLHKSGIQTHYLENLCQMVLDGIKYRDEKNTGKKKYLYTYRGYPRNVVVNHHIISKRTWCVCGHDNKISSSGILEWCDDYLDAAMIKNEMERDIGRFTNLSVTEDK